MSPEAAIIRALTRSFVKRRANSLSVATLRRRMKLYEHLVPRPPSGTITLQRALGGIPATRTSRRESKKSDHILYLHGGGYVSGSPALYGHITWRLAAAARAQVVAIAYRLAPENPFPAALDDAAAAWNGLLEEGANPKRCVIMGDSAGGGLALALALKLRDEGTSSPAAIVALSPWTDLAMTGASDQNADDPMLNFEDLAPLARIYLAGANARDPYASPLFGDLRGLPPTLLHVGSDEILHDDSVRMAERMQEVGCDVSLEIWSRMLHVWHAFAPVMPEARHAIERIGSFVRDRIS